MMKTANSTFLSLLLMFCRVSMVMSTEREPKEEEVEEVSAREGDIAILPCRLRHNRRNVRVVWLDPDDFALTVNERTTTEDLRFSTERSFASSLSWDLVIRDVNVKDRGMYKCKLTSDPIMIKNVRLQVIASVFSEPSLVDNSSIRITSLVGEEAILPCGVNGVLKPYNVRWYFNENFVLTKNDKIIFNDPRLSIMTPYRFFNLRITDLTLIDSGYYQCKIDTVPPKVRQVILDVRSNLPTGCPEPPKSTITSASEEENTRSVASTDTDEGENISRAQISYYKEQKKTAKLQRRLMQEQLEYYTHMNFILANARDDIVSFLRNHTIV